MLFSKLYCARYNSLHGNLCCVIVETEVKVCLSHQKITRQTYSNIPPLNYDFMIKFMFAIRNKALNIRRLPGVGGGCDRIFNLVHLI